MTRTGSKKSLLESAGGLGERKIIEIIQDHLDLMPNLAVSFGDDVSALSIGKECLAVLKTDMLVSKTDVPPSMTLWQAARKAVVMNVSDFAAKGVKPIAMLVSLGLPKDMTAKDVVELAEGLNAGAREYGAYVVGGDTGEASDLVINMSLFGMARRNHLMLRSGAKPGDFLAVTGPFGNAAAGLRTLLGNLDVPEKVRGALVKSVLLPHARLKEGLVLSHSKAVSAAIDSSDGLAWSLHEIARASNVGLLVDRLPAAWEAMEFAEYAKIDLAELVFYGGEEYEILLTIRPDAWAAAEKAVTRMGGQLLQIGKVTGGKRIVSEIGGMKRIIEPRGYEHFKS